MIGTGQENKTSADAAVPGVDGAVPAVELGQPPPVLRSVEASASRHYDTGKAQWTHGQAMPNSWHVLLGPCPACGSPTFDYGGGWRCRELHCLFSAGNPVPNLGPRPDWWPIIDVRMDGSAWCATFLDFKNIQESPAGFGDSPREAVKALHHLTDETVPK